MSFPVSSSALLYGGNGHRKKSTGVGVLVGWLVGGARFNVPLDTV